MMRSSNCRLLTCVLAVLVLISSVSAVAGPAGTQYLTPAAEHQVMGGNNRCATAWGLGLALAAASLSPCGVLCASLAWYDLALIGAYCS